MSEVLRWLGWGAAPLAIGVYLTMTIVGKEKTLFLPGETTSGHYQIEQACQACHTPFVGVTQEACLSCHGDELKAINDSHPKSKFTDPRNADRVAILDARQCITCHQEHRPTKTRAMGVTLANDYCFYCHVDIAKDRPSHANLGFETCASTGCHNFHDNTALYEDFLLKHRHEPRLLPKGVVPTRQLVAASQPHADEPPLPLTIREQNAPASVTADSQLLHDWETTAHARARVNCLDCHQDKQASSPSGWINKVGHPACQRCHESEVEGFLAGKHGMRLAQDLSPMRPEMARQPMQPTAHGKELGCTSCHAAHRFDTQYAAVEACLSCHNDEHSRAYKASPHFRLWSEELRGHQPRGAGVSCATCHLPSEIRKEESVEIVRIQHNQNLNLRPNEKMIRSVCLHCHGLGFSLDALADAALVKRNFSGHPSIHVESVEMAEQRAATSR